MKRRTAVYAPNVEQLVAARDEAVKDADDHKGNVVRIARKNARLCRLVAEHILTGQQAGGAAKAAVDQLAERLLIEGFNLGIEFAQLRREAGERP
ncbi:hypothetical protein [Streptomyces lunaelactis]|uniref:hypothetical protein n=1 Tax=Streptomyces lunaelactis TaxID=1535768 RepID=UPI00158550C9|nr:hypothetical protein [Streptomyces lunaelactis]NUK22035.1 hypothetical protein [Streptomyces lunaelactis]